jgi:NADH-quinone oxidoreductase subunit M
MANCGLPGTSGFVGEFLVILGAVQFDFWIGVIAATTLVLSAAYSLWMYKRVIFGAVANPVVSQMHDIDGREILALALLAVAVLWIGVYPAPMIDAMHTSVDSLLTQVAQSKLVSGSP